MSQPVKSAFVSALSLLLCLQLAACQPAAAKADTGVPAVAFPAMLEKTVSTNGTDGSTGQFKEDVISYELWEKIEELPALSSSVEELCRQKYISAWSGEMQTSISAGQTWQYQSKLDSPYTAAAFIISITGIDEDPQPLTDFINPAIEAEVEETVLLHPGFDPPQTLEISCVFSSQEELASAGLQPGGRYLVYGSYEEKDKSVSGLLSVRNPGPDYAADYYPRRPDGSTSEKPAYELLAAATISPIDTDLDSFLARPENELWVRTLSQAETDQQTFPVIGTDMLESLYPFWTNAFSVSEGSVFSQEDYASGRNVCLISETAAAASGLHVGDTISLSFYWGADPYIDMFSLRGNPTAQRYSAAFGFLETRDYQIIGLYHQAEPWSDSPYAFTPNTVFLPNASLPDSAYALNQGNFVSLVLKDGAAGEFEASLGELGFPENSFLICENPEL